MNATASAPVNLDRAIARNIAAMIDAVAEADPRERSKLAKWTADEQAVIKNDAFVELCKQNSFCVRRKRGREALTPLLGESPLPILYSDYMQSAEDPYELAKRALNSARKNYGNRKDEYRDHVVSVANSDALDAIAARADRQFANNRRDAAESEPEDDARARIDLELERKFNWITIHRKPPKAAADQEWERPASKERWRILMRRLSDEERGALDMSVISLGMLEKLDALRAYPGLWRLGGWRGPPARLTVSLCHNSTRVDYKS